MTWASCTQRDDRDQVFHWLEKACDIKDPKLGMIGFTS